MIGRRSRNASSPSTAPATPTAAGPLPELPDGLHTVTWTFSDEKPDKGKILASHRRKDNDKDFRDRPEKYKECTFSVGQIIVNGDLLDNP